MSSIVQIKWIIKVWVVSSRVLLHQDLGVVLMSSIDSCPKYSLCVQSNSNQLLMPLNKRKNVSYYKKMKLTSIQLVECSLL